MSGYTTIKAYKEGDSDIDWENCIQQTDLSSEPPCLCDWCRMLRSKEWPETMFKMLGPRGQAAFVRAWIMVKL